MENLRPSKEKERLIVSRRLHPQRCYESCHGRLLALSEHAAGSDRVGWTSNRDDPTFEEYVATDGRLGEINSGKAYRNL
jgi:hypothetical protein